MHRAGAITKGMHQPPLERVRAKCMNGDPEAITFPGRIETRPGSKADRLKKVRPPKRKMANCRLPHGTKTRRLKEGDNPGGDAMNHPHGLRKYSKRVLSGVL